MDSLWMIGSVLSGITEQQTNFVHEEEFAMTNRKVFVWLVVGVTCALMAILVGTAVAQSGLTPKEQLGKDIFFDETLSVNANQSCAACHGPEAGWTGPESATNAHGAVYEGSVPGRFGNRKPPSAAYATQSPILSVDKKGLFVGGNFWDGRATGEMLGIPSAEQAKGPFLNPVEQALPSADVLVAKVCGAAYGDLFRAVWGNEACDPANVATAYNNIGYSIAAYEASPEVNAFSSKFDYAKVGMAKLSQQEQRGYALFRGKAKCARCHIANGQEPLFTDYTFDNLGVPMNPENPVYNVDPGFVDLGLGGFLETRSDYAPYAAENMGKQKVPTLRNVDKGSPDIVKAYTHNGYFKTLEGIVNFYNTRDVKPVCPGDYTEAQALAAGCWPAPEVAATVNTAELGNLGLTPDEEADIVAFLKTLSDGYQP
jgi:cytochrome c peroxidase